MASIKIYSKEQVDTLLAQIPSGPSEYVKDVTGSDYTETGYNGQKITVTDEDDVSADITTAKYYTGTGQNVDGSMTQKAITDAIAGAGGGGAEAHTFTTLGELRTALRSHPYAVLTYQIESTRLIVGQASVIHSLDNSPTVIVFRATNVGSSNEITDDYYPLTISTFDADATYKGAFAYRINSPASGAGSIIRLSGTTRFEVSLITAYY